MLHPLACCDGYRGSETSDHALCVVSSFTTIRAGSPIPTCIHNKPWRLERVICHTPHTMPVPMHWCGGAWPNWYCIPEDKAAGSLMHIWHVTDCDIDKQSMPRSAAPGTPCPTRPKCMRTQVRLRGCGVAQCHGSRCHAPLSCYVCNHVETGSKSVSSECLCAILVCTLRSKTRGTHVWQAPGTVRASCMHSWRVASAPPLGNTCAVCSEYPCRAATLPTIPAMRFTWMHYKAFCLDTICRAWPDPTKEPQPSLACIPGMHVW